MVAERRGNVVVLARPPVGASQRLAAVERLRQHVQRDTILYAVRRAHDAGFGWLVVDIMLIDGRNIACITADVAMALECFDPAREVGMKLRRGATLDILGECIDGRLSTLLFGAPDLLQHAMIG